jgi:hypothetical protein
VWLSGAEGEELTAALALCMGVFGLSSHLPQSEVFTLRSLRKKRKKRTKGIRVANKPLRSSLMVEMYRWRREGIRRWCSGGARGMMLGKDR